MKLQFIYICALNFHISLFLKVGHLFKPQSASGFNQYLIYMQRRITSREINMNLFSVKKPLLRIVLIVFISLPAIIFAQNESDERPLLEMSDGVSLGSDSLFLINMRFRMQNRFAYFSMLDNAEEPGFEARVRRLRFRVDGYLYSTNLSYYIQLSFSRGDLDIVEGFAPNIIRDAMVYYSFNENFYVGFGQSKLPGNRQRVISSGNLQMPDRSIANQLFNIDRDFGFFAYQTLPLGKTIVNLKTAITSGEGRNSLFSNSGLAYTGRLEFLPFGNFINNGDYSEGDLEYEENLKASFAGTYSYNHKAVRSGGQLGLSLDMPLDIQSIILDLMLKYRGWALLGEYFDKRLWNTSSESTSLASVYYGQGYNVQLSKTFKNHFELGLRYSGAVSQNPNHSDFSTRGVSIGKYLNGHRIKIQGYLGVDNRSESTQSFRLNNRLNAIMQVEFGI